MKRIDRYDQQGNYEGTNYEYHEHELYGYGDSRDTKTPPRPLGLFGRTFWALFGLAIGGIAIVFVAGFIGFIEIESTTQDKVAQLVAVPVLGYLAYRCLRYAFSKKSTE